MGRLFWKFFALVALAQMVSMLAVAGVFWLEHRRQDAEWAQREAAFGDRGEAAFRAERHGPPDHLGPPGHPGGADRFGPPGGRPPPGKPHGFHIPPEPMVAAVLTAIVVALVLAAYIAKPVRRLRRAFEAVAGGDLGMRIGPQMGRRRDELADLGQDFDSMAARLQTLVEGQRRLLHDVSHELRSPLARLQAASGLLRQQPERMMDTIGRIERECERMDSLVGQLLTLSRLEAGVAGRDESVDLAELLDGLIEDARFEAAHSERLLSVVGQAEGCVHANPELLHRAIENVVRNAIKYAPAGSEVEIGLLQTGNRFELRVADRGPGVPQGDEEAIFAPFYRTGEAREGTGYGLGLAIARRVVLGLGGEISAHNRTGGGLEVRLVLPLQDCT